LPRAYHTLSIQDSRCLLVYLAYLEKELNPAFRKILSRIVIEYIGNFTLKHCRSTLSEEMTAAALFFGFAAMYWKNLRQPPAGHEDDWIFERFFHWAQGQRNKNRFPGRDMELISAHMSEAMQRIFPQPDAFGRLPRTGRYQPETALIALRNGQSGMAAVLRCLGPSVNLYKSATASRIHYTQVPATLQSLLRTIKAQWAFESPSTRTNIRRFLNKLADRYRVAGSNAATSGYPAARNLRFTASKTNRMIQTFIASLV